VLREDDSLYDSGELTLLESVDGNERSLISIQAKMAIEKPPLSLLIIIIISRIL
jgi:hypothetical protein